MTYGFNWVGFVLAQYFEDLRGGGGKNAILIYIFFFFLKKINYDPIFVLKYFLYTFEGLLFIL